MERPVVEMPFLKMEDADMKTINEVLVGNFLQRGVGLSIRSVNRA
jgi:hypothetical protein